MTQERHDDFFRLLHNFKKFRPKSLSPSELPSGEFFMLLRIQHSIDCPEQKIRGGVHVSGIQSGEDMSKPAVSQLLGSLERKGYIERNVDREDRRKVTVALTEKGKTFLLRQKKELKNPLMFLLNGMVKKSSGRFAG